MPNNIFEKMMEVIQAVAELPNDGFYADCLFTSKIIPQAQALLTPTAGGFVTVWREDLEKAIDFIENTGGVYWGEVADRLKAALGKE